MYHYGLPSASVLENWLYQQEEFLLEAFEKKALPRSKRTAGLSSLQYDAKLLSLFWRTYVHAPPGEVTPKNRLALHHYSALRILSEQKIQRCNVKNVVADIRKRLNTLEVRWPSFEEYRDFTYDRPPYRVRRKLREQFSKLENNHWRAGSRGLCETLLDDKDNA